MNYLDLLMSFLKWTSAVAAGSFALVGTGLYYFQSSLIYPASFPAGSRTVVDTPDKYGIPEYESIFLNTPDGEKLHCYVMMQTKEVARERPTILLFHANAGNMGHRLPIARVFHAQMKLNVVMLSYRGYGKSSGIPSEAGIKTDASVFLRYVLDHDVLQNTQLFAYGQSIGGAVAIDIVHKNQARFTGLIVENTFLSVRTLIPNVLPLARPFASLCHQFWDSASVIETITIPILFLSGAKDELVPPSQMALLYQLSKASKKEWHEFADGTHNTTVSQRDYMKIIHEFIQKLSNTHSS